MSRTVTAIAGLAALIALSASAATAAGLRVRRHHAAIIFCFVATKKGLHRRFALIGVDGR